LFPAQKYDARNPYPNTNIMHMKKIFTLFLFVCSFQFVNAQQAKQLLIAGGEPDATLQRFVKKARMAQLDRAAITALKAEAPERLQLRIPMTDGELTLELEAASIFADNFTLTEAVGQNTNRKYAYPKGLYYRGAISGKPGSVAAISIFDNEIIGVLADKVNGNMVIGAIKDAEGNPTGQHIIYKEKDLLIRNTIACDTDDKDLVDPHEHSPLPQFDFSNANVQYVGCPVSVYVEADNSIYTGNGSNTINVGNYVTGVFNILATIYANENIHTHIREIKVWTVADPYVSATNTATALNLFNTQMSTGFNGDLAHLFSFRGLGGGRAYIGAMCGSMGIRTAVSGNMSNSYNQFPTYSWSSMVITHEMGHNLNSPHTQSCSWPGGAIDNCFTTEGGCPPGPAPVNGGTIMSYCHLVAAGINLANGFGPLPGNRIRNYVTASNCNCTCNNMTVAITKSDAGCGAPTGSATATVTGGTGPFTYLWSNGQTTQTATGLAAGNHHVTVTGNPANCKVVMGVRIINAAGGAVDASTTPAGTVNACAGNVTLSANANGGAYTYQWFLNGNPIGGATARTYSAAGNGNYTVRVTSGTCNSTSSAITVNLTTPPTAGATAAGATSFCAGGSVTMNASPASGYNYQWLLNGSPITGAVSASYTASATGNYSVRVFATGCESFSPAISVTARPLPDATVTAGGSLTFCAGGSVVLSAPAGNTYQWLLNGSPIGGATGQTYTAIAAGNYSVTVTNAGCSRTSTVSAVNVLTAATASITPNSSTNFCAGSSVVLSAPVSVGYAYQWYNNGNPISGATNSSLLVNAAGNYTVKITVNTCESTSPVQTVIVRPIPVTTVSLSGSASFCDGGSVTMNASTATGNTYQWYRNAVLIGGATNNSYTATQAGNYYVVVTKDGCTFNSSVTTVAILPKPTVSISPAAATLIKSRALTLTGSGAASYNWAQQQFVITSSGNQAVVSPPSSITYTIEGTGANGCKNTATAQINVVGCGDVKNLSATPYSPGRVLLQWTNPPDINSDTLEYKTVTAVNWNKIFVQGNQYMLNGLQPNTQYMFRVTSLCSFSSLYFYSDTGYFKTPVVNDIFIKLYPNPFNRQAVLEIVTPDNYTGLSIDIFNAAGQKMTTLAGGQSGLAGQILKTIYAPEWAAGTYTCVVRINGKRYSMKFQKE
jgi:Metallo-peptidase family M12/Fibronectin type III domain/SprB repeat/Reprolysin family propeptide